MVIDTLWAPFIPDGVMAVIVVADITDTPVAATPPTVTRVVPVKFWPVMVIVVWPIVGPEVGVTLAMLEIN